MERRLTGADWDRRPSGRLERRLSGADWDRRPSGRLDRRLTTSHSRKTGRPHRLSPPLLVLTPQLEKERRAQSPFEEENQDVQPPSFEFTHRSKEGAKDDAPPNERGDFPVADRGCKGGTGKSPLQVPLLPQTFRNRNAYNRARRDSRKLSRTGFPARSDSRALDSQRTVPPQ